MAAPQMNPPQTFQGSCHCQHIKYTVSLTLPSDGPPKGARCNCTICLKTGYVSLQVKEPDFHLTAPSSLSDVSDYKISSPLIHRYICPNCGINVWVKGTYELEGQKTDFFSVNGLTLDQPQEGLDLSQLKMEYWDGRHDNWTGGKKSSPWPGGCI